jgi:hypothetical protein
VQLDDEGGEEWFCEDVDCMLHVRCTFDATWIEVTQSDKTIISGRQTVGKKNYCDFHAFKTRTSVQKQSTEETAQLS